jgi:hypothetical protein
MLMYQLTRMCREKGAVKHDDRADALALGVKYFQDILAISAKEAAIALKRDEWTKMIMAFQNHPQEATDRLVLGQNYDNLTSAENAVHHWI